MQLRVQVGVRLTRARNASPLSLVFVMETSAPVPSCPSLSAHDASYISS